MSYTLINLEINKKMSNSPGKYGNVRKFLDNLGNEKIKICKNCGTVFSYQNETTILCLSCDFEEEISTCLLYTSPSPRDRYISRMPSSA